MARKNPLSDSEIAVCRRLRELRRDALLSRVAFAKAIGVDTGRYANYEHGRARLPYMVGVQVCERFDINQRWLATGKTPMRPFFKAAPVNGEHKSFLNVYQQDLARHVDQRWNTEKVLATVGGMREDSGFPYYPRIGAAFPEVATVALQKQISAALDELPDEAQGRYIATLVKASQAFLRGPKNEVLTTSGISEQSTPVALSLKELLNRVSAATTARGKKGELASFLRVSPSRLSEWLAGDHEPGAEVALRMLGWVLSEEAKQQTSGGALTLPEAKTQNKRHIHETTKSSKSAKEWPKTRPKSSK